MEEKIQRREFLKLASAASLGLTLPSFGWLKQNSGTAIGKSNILIVVFDALSAYHLSTYGYSRETMPNLNSLLNNAIIYHNHYSGGNYTTPGTASILTGTLPWSHRAIVHNDTVADEFVTKNIFHEFSNHYSFAYSHNILVNTQLKQFINFIDEYTPRDKLFLGTGKLYNNIFSSDDDIASLSWIRALNQSDDGYSYSLFLPKINEAIRNKHIRDFASDYPRGLPNIDVDDYYILDQGIDYLIQQIEKAPQPFLGYYHFLPPHAPYNPRKEYVGRFDDDGYHVIEKGRNAFSRGKTLEQLNKENTQYDEFILYADNEFARLFNFLVQNKVLNNTWVIFTSDHGELFERGIVGHMTPMLHQPVIRVPLIIFEPGRQSRLDIYENTSGIDLLPTIMQINGQDIPEWIEGQVLPPYNHMQAQRTRNIFALQAKGTGKQDPIVKATVMLVSGHYKIMYYFGYRELEETGPMIEFYDLENDPQEIENLYPRHKFIADDFLEIVLAKIDEVNRPYQ